MKVAIEVIRVFSKIPPYKLITTKYNFVENGSIGKIVEIEALNNMTKSILILGIVKGKFGTHDHIYKWLNKPVKVGDKWKNVKKL